MTFALHVCWQLSAKQAITFLCEKKEIQKKRKQLDQLEKQIKKQIKKQKENKKKPKKKR